MEEDIAERCSLLTPKENQKSVALCGATFCLPAACKDAPLGQRQGGVFRLPPPYLWTPLTPQQVKGCTPLTILKKKSKHKKASAAPVGAIALTLFSLLHLEPLSRCATAPPGGASARLQRRAFVESGAANAVFRYDPSRENSVWSAPQSATNAKFKIIFPLNMARAKRKPFQIVYL